MLHDMFFLLSSLSSPLCPLFVLSLLAVEAVVKHLPVHQSLNVIYSDFSRTVGPVSFLGMFFFFF